MISPLLNRLLLITGFLIPFLTHANTAPSSAKQIEQLVAPQMTAFLKAEAIPGAAVIVYDQFRLADLSIARQGN